MYAHIQYDDPNATITTIITEAKKLVRILLHITQMFVQMYKCREFQQISHQPSWNLELVNM